MRGSTSRELWSWALLAFAAILLIVLAYFWLPGQKVDGLKGADRLKAENDIRTSGIQAVGAIAVFLGALMTARTFHLTRRGQLKDRLHKAVEQLTSKESLALRLGAIAQLKRLAAEGDRDQHWEVMEILTAFLRDNAEWKGGPVPARAPADVQAVVDVLGRRDRSREDDDQKLDLSHTDLRKVIFKDAHFEGARLFKAHLEEAISVGETRFDGALLTRAVLDGAILDGIHLTGAWLTSAEARGVRLRGADLTGADLTEMKLQGADLGGAIEPAIHVAEIDDETVLPDGARGSRKTPPT